MSAIATLTMNPSIDTSTSTEHVAAEIKLRCREPHDDPGGGGINVSRAINKLGGESTALYPAGGWFGRRLEDLLEREELEHIAIPIRDATRQDLIVLDEATKRQYRFQMPGPKLSEAELDACCETIRNLSPKPKYLVASGSLPPGVPEDFYVRIGEIARELGARYVVDTSGAPLLEAARAGGIYLLKPNLRELKTLTGQEVKDEAQLEEAVGKMVGAGKVEILLISLGAGGAILATAEGCEYLRAPTVPVQSKVGAGDSMVGGFILKLSQGEPLKNAALYGVAAGAAAVMTPGTGLCRKEDADHLYQRMLSQLRT